MDTYHCLIIDVSSTAESDQLIAYLDEMGFEGFEEQPHQLKAYRPAGEWPVQLITEYLQERSLPFTLERIEKTNWNQLWESHFEPVQVDDFVGMRADFHPPFSEVAIELVITPKMSFGTGHHATTRLMIRQMRSMIKPGDRVLDFGTGTGVLAILAKKMGAGQVIGIDIEDWSIENARENAAVNQVSEIVFLVGDKVTLPGPFDRILANINRNILLEHMTALGSCLSASGTLVLSGVLTEDVEVMDQSLRSAGLIRTDLQEEKGWICVQAVHSQPNR